MTTNAPTNQAPTNGAPKTSQAMVRSPQERLANIKGLLDKSKSSIAAVLPKHITIDRFLRIVATACSKSPDLLDCSPQSIVLAAAQGAALGLDCNTALGLGYLVPFGKQAQFIPGYRGLVRLAIQSGEVQWVQSRVVREKDTWEIDYGTEQQLKHTPFMAIGDPGPMVAVYAVAQMKNGAKLFEFMTKHEVDAIRARSKASASGPWTTDYEEMSRKTVVRRLCKSLPLSEENLAKALEHQARAEAGDGPDFSDVAFIDVPGEDVQESAAPHADRGAALTEKIKAS